MEVYSDTCRRIAVRCDIIYYRDHATDPLAIIPIRRVVSWRWKQVNELLATYIQRQSEETVGPSCLLFAHGFNDSRDGLCLGMLALGLGWLPSKLPGQGGGVCQGCKELVVASRDPLEAVIVFVWLGARVRCDVATVQRGTSTNSRTNIGYNPSVRWSKV